MADFGNVPLHYIPMTRPHVARCQYNDTHALLYSTFFIGIYGYIYNGNKAKKDLFFYVKCKLPKTVQIIFLALRCSPRIFQYIVLAEVV